MQLSISIWPSGYRGSLRETHVPWRIASVKILEKLIFPPDEQIRSIWRKTMGNIDMRSYIRTELHIVVLLPKGMRKKRLEPFVEALALEVLPKAA